MADCPVSWREVLVQFELRFDDMTDEAIAREIIATVKASRPRVQDFLCTRGQPGVMSIHINLLDSNTPRATLLQEQLEIQRIICAILEDHKKLMKGVGHDASAYHNA